MVMPQERISAVLESRLAARTARVAVLGLGYAGLPMAVALAESGFPVIGLDVDVARVQAVASGQSPVTDVGDVAIERLVRDERLTASTDFSLLAGTDVALICVPTPLTPAKSPDLRFVEAAGRSIGEFLHPGMLIILQSTVAPGTTRTVLLPALGQAELIVGGDFFVAFCPERIDPGNPTFNVKNTPKLVGGLTSSCTKLATSLYRAICDTVVPCSAPEVAEMAKLVENTFRFINISFVNEMAVMCDRLGIPIWEVLDAANSKPFAFLKHSPGPGVGGHCIPVVPFYLEAVAREHGLNSGLVETAGRINAEQPRFVVQKLGRLLGERGKTLRNARVLCIGVTYKANVADLRESAALSVLEELLWQGADASYWDPFFPEVNAGRRKLRSVELSDEVITAADAVVLLVPHSGPDLDALARKSRLVLDSMNILAGRGLDNVVPL
ncbi:MAG: nucleotide sugar dehydrogenase [Chloroflexi bacterium]|nr:nucleotide sugar dehydrogenase [Chloroflexota bacterium]